MKYRKVLIIVLAIMLMGLALIVSPGCTSTLKAVTGTYSYYEVIDGKVTYFRWNPMSMRYHTRVLERKQTPILSRPSIQNTGKMKQPFTSGTFPSSMRTQLPLNA